MRAKAANTGSRRKSKSAKQNSSPSKGKMVSRDAKRSAPPRVATNPVPNSLQIDRKTLALSNTDKILYPETGFTKGQVIDYYQRIAPFILPHLKSRPLTLKRYPNGVDKLFFYEKRCPSHRPDWVSTAKVWSEGNDQYIDYCLVEDTATLVWLANLACLEMHTLLSKMPQVQRPTSMVFDLDPGPPADILDSTRVGFIMRDVLANMGLQSFAKTSGSKGLHLWVPLNTSVTFDQTKEFAHTMALMMEREHPKEIVSMMKKELRKGKVLIDWSQNDPHKTTACAYTLRARAEPTVSCPVTWEELEQAVNKKDSARIAFLADDVLKRVSDLGDLFAPVLKVKQKLPK